MNKTNKKPTPPKKPSRTPPVRQADALEKMLGVFERQTESEGRWLRLEARVRALLALVHAQLHHEDAAEASPWPRDLTGFAVALAVAGVPQAEVLYEISALRGQAAALAEVLRSQMKPAPPGAPPDLDQLLVRIELHGREIAGNGREIEAQGRVIQTLAEGVELLRREQAAVGPAAVSAVRAAAGAPEHLTAEQRVAFAHLAEALGMPEARVCLLPEDPKATEEPG